MAAETQMMKTTLYIPLDVASSITAMARQRGRSEASLMREAIETFIEGANRPLPTSIGVVSIEGVNGEDTEEWLLPNWRPE